MTSILVYGEDRNDTSALKELIVGLCPSLRPADVTELREPPTLQRGSDPAKVRSWAARAASAAKAKQIVMGAAACVLVHNDADRQDDGEFETERTRELRAAGLDRAHAVVPVETIEAWWLLFPEATESVVPSWRGALRRRPGDVDRQSGPKDDLIRRTRAKQERRPYHEKDSVAIARAIVAGGHLDRPWPGRSDSFRRFAATVAACCPQS